MRGGSFADAFPALHRDGMGVVDVGARGGAHPSLASIAAEVNLVGFEPEPAECARLGAGPNRGFRSLTFLPYALGRDGGRRTLYECRSGGASSFYRPNRAFLDRFRDAGRFDVVATHEVEVRALDSLRAELPGPVDFIKVDTQGAELDVLAGAEATLARAAGVEVEVEFSRLYESQPLFRDVDAWLSARGFSLFKLRRMHWVRGTRVDPRRSAGQLTFGDALYLRDPLAGGAASIDPRLAESLVVLASLYDLHDFALELLDSPAVAAAMPAAAARGYVEARVSGSWLGGIWKRRADRLFAGAWLHGYAGEWARGDLDFYTRV